MVKKKIKNKKNYEITCKQTFNAFIYVATVSGLVSARADLLVYKLSTVEPL